MKQFYLIAGAIFMSSLTSYAQNIRVLDSAKNTPVAGATVVALNQANGKVEKQGSTDVDGAFISVNPVNDVLYLSITAIGYKKAVVKQIQGNQTILLSPDKKQLKEVKITANKSPIKFNGNVMEYDISQVPNAEYLSLPDIIDHLPFLQVTEKGEIKMMNETLTILIDNRPSILYKDGSSLKSIPPQAIEKVEVTLTPTARNGGKTINITLKHDYFLGWNGSADIGGSRFGYRPTAAVSYWRKKFGFDASVNYNHGTSNSEANTTINYLQQHSTLNATDQIKNHSNSGGFNFSSFYNIDDFNSFDLQFTISSSKNRALTNSIIVTQAMGVQDANFSTINNNTSGLSNGISLNYTHKYPKAGNVFYLLSSFRNSSSDRDQLLVNSVLNGSVLKNTGFVNNTKYDENTFEAILQQNVNKAFKYTIGSKLIIRNNKSDNALDTGSVKIITPFEMQQLVSSTYADADWTVKKFTVHTGIRFDYNVNNYKPIISKQEFTNITPNVSLTYNINPANLLMFTYGRRVTRPNTNTLLPAVNPVNSYQQNKGNEKLGNQLNNNWGLQYYGNYKLARIGFNFSYTRVSGLIRDIASIGTNDIIQSISTNVNLYESYTAGFSADFTLLKKLRFSHSSNCSYLIQNSGIYSNKLWSGYLSDRISYEISKQNSLNISATNYSPNVNLQGIEQGMAYFNWSLGYAHYFDLMKKYPTTLNIGISNPTLYNGLSGYNTTNTPDFTMRRDTRRSNAVLSIGIRIQIKGKQLGNRTFNKIKSIQNNDLSTQ